MTLTAAQYYEIKKTVWEISCARAMETTGQVGALHVDAFREQGVWLYLSRMDTIYRVKVRMNRAGCLPVETQRHCFKQTKSSTTRNGREGSRFAAARMALPRSIDRMKISRMDLTCDLTFQEAGSGAAIHPHFAESVCFTHHKRVCFREGTAKRKM